MHRFTARFVLVLLLVGIFAPVGLAISAPAPHACCMRKAMHASPHQTEFNPPPSCCNHDCCRPLTVSHWAHVTTKLAALSRPVSVSLRSHTSSFNPASVVDRSHSGRAPPQFSIA